MKCPFRTIRKVRYLHPEFNNLVDYDETIEFSYCLREECPYFGETVMQHRPMGGFETVTHPVCRRVKDG